jgi:hypothetical protein
MDDDFIDSYIELKMEEVMRLQLHPHPVVFDMYYKCGSRPPRDERPKAAGHPAAFLIPDLVRRLHTESRH